MPYFIGSPPNDFVEEQTLFDTSCLEPERPCVGIPNSICTLTRHCMCVPGFKKTPFGCRSSGLEENSFPPFIEIRNRTHHSKERRPIAIKQQCKQGYVEVKGLCIVGKKLTLLLYKSLLFIYLFRHIFGRKVPAR